MTQGYVPNQPSRFRFIWGGLAFVLILILIGGGAYLLGSHVSDSSPTPTAAVSPPASTPPMAERATTTPASPEATPTATPIPPSALGTSNLYIEYILDASGSMNEALSDGTVKLAVARQLLAEHLRALRPETNVGLRAYGHRVPYDQKARSCEDIELISPVKKGQVETIVTWLGDFHAQGMTPLAESLRMAASDFVIEPERINALIMISDGEETCGNDPCTLVEELQDQGLLFTLHVIGLAVDEPTRKQLTCIADAGQGTYHDVGTEQDLKDALKEIRDAITRGEVVSPPLGPDDPWIAYVGEDEHIWLIRPDGRDSHGLSDQPGYNPTWSPDGDLLAYESPLDDGAAVIYVADPETGEERTLVTDGRSPTWSPDSSTIAFVRHHREGPDPSWSVHLVDVESGQERQLASSAQEYPETEPWLGAAWHALDQEEGNLSGVASGLQWGSQGEMLLLRKVYAGQWSGEWEVALIDAQTGKVTILPAGYYPSLAPVGGQVAYCGEGSLHVMNGAGAGDMQLSHGDDCRQPVWSPNGRLVLFGTGESVWRVNADGQDEYPVVVPEAFGCAHYSFNVDGKAFAFSQVRGDDKDTKVSIWRTMIDGSDLLELAPGGQPAWQPARAWAATTRIAFAQMPTYTPSPTPSRTLTPSPTATTRPTDTPTAVPTNTPKPTPQPTKKPKPTATAKPTAAPLSPKGKIAFRSSRGGVWIMNPDGTDQQPLQNTNIYYRALELDRWSPSMDKRVAVQTVQTACNAEVFYLWADGRTICRLTSNSHMDWDPVLSADGYWVAFVSNRNGNDEIFILTVEATQELRLSNNDWEWDKHPSWSPNDQQLVFYSNRITGRKQIWVMNRDGTNAHNISNNQYDDWDPVWIKRW